MPNAIENALNRVSPEQKEKINLALEQAREAIPNPNIQDVDIITRPVTPSRTTPDPSGLESKQLDAITAANIEKIQSSKEGYQNAVERALTHPTIEAQKTEKQLEKER